MRKTPMDTNQIKAQQEKDRIDIGNLPNGSNKPLSWCNEHDCKLGTCFPLHYPESSVTFNNFESCSVEQELTEASIKYEPEIIENIDAQRHLERKEATEKWMELWKHSRK